MTRAAASLGRASPRRPPSCSGTQTAHQYARHSKPMLHHEELGDLQEVCASRRENGNKTRNTSSIRTTAMKPNPPPRLRMHYPRDVFSISVPSRTMRSLLAWRRPAIPVRRSDHASLGWTRHGALRRPLPRTQPRLLRRNDAHFGQGNQVRQFPVTGQAVGGLCAVGYRAAGFVVPPVTNLFTVYSAMGAGQCTGIHGLAGRSSTRAPSTTWATHWRKPKTPSRSPR